MPLSQALQLKAAILSRTAGLPEDHDGSVEANLRLAFPLPSADEAEDDRFRVLLDALKQVHGPKS